MCWWHQIAKVCAGLIYHFLLIIKNTYIHEQEQQQQQTVNFEK